MHDWYTGFRTPFLLEWGRTIQPSGRRESVVGEVGRQDTSSTATRDPVPKWTQFDAPVVRFRHTDSLHRDESNNVAGILWTEDSI